MIPHIHIRKETIALSWIVQVEKITVQENGKVVVDGTAYGNGREDKIRFSGQYKVTDGEWEAFSMKATNPRATKHSPLNELTDVIEELAQKAYELIQDDSA